MVKTDIPILAVPLGGVKAVGKIFRIDLMAFREGRHDLVHDLPDPGQHFRGICNAVNSIFVPLSPVFKRSLPGLHGLDIDDLFPQDLVFRAGGYPQAEGFIFLVKKGQVGQHRVDPQKIKLFEQHTEHFPQLFRGVHCHGLGTNPLQGQLYLGFPVLGLGVFQIQKTDIGLLEYATEAFQDLVFRIRVRRCGISCNLDPGFFGESNGG